MKSPAVSGHTLHRLSRSQRNGPENHEMLGFQKLLRQFKSLLNTVLLYDAVCISKEARRRLAAIAALRSKKNRAKHNRPDPVFFTTFAASGVASVPNVGEVPVSKVEAEGGKIKKGGESEGELPVLLYDAVCISKEARRRLAAIAALRSKKNRAKHNRPDPELFTTFAASGVASVPNVGEVPVSKVEAEGGKIKKGGESEGELPVDAFSLGEFAAGERSQTQGSSNHTGWSAEGPALQDQQVVDLLVIMKKFKDAMQKVLLYDAVCISKEARRRLAAIAALRSKKNRTKHNRPDPELFTTFAASGVASVPNVGEVPVSKVEAEGGKRKKGGESEGELPGIPENAALDQHLTLPGYPINFAMGKGIAKHFQKRQGSDNSVCFPGLSDASVEILPGFSPSAVQSRELESVAHSLNNFPQTLRRTKGQGASSGPMTKPIVSVHQGTREENHSLLVLPPKLTGVPEPKQFANNNL
ncbi:UNVERIFIED_CONTAM: hypothetical protein FKN15_048518 [Acipenser sinensis]